MTAGKKKEGGSMLTVLKTETEKSMFGQVAVGHGVILPGSRGRQGRTCVSTYQQYQWHFPIQNLMCGWFY